MIENGNPPAGLGTVPINTGNVTHDDLTTYLGPTAYSKGIIFSSLTLDGHLYLQGDWLKKGIASGFSVVIYKDDVRKKFTAKRIDRIENGDLTRIVLSVKNPLDLTSFIGSSGFSSISTGVNVMLFQGVDNYTDTEYFSSLYVKRNNIGLTGYNAKIFWQNSPSVYKSTIRWRKKPEIFLSGTVSYTIITGGTYSTFPDISLISSTGRGESIEILGSLTGFSAFGGTGYTSSPTITFSGGGGSGALASCIGLSGQIVSATLLSGGTGYNELPNYIISGGTGATLSLFLQGTSVRILEKGVDYFSHPMIKFLGGSGVGLSAIARVEFTSISSTGDDWNYFSASGITTHEIVGLTKGITYEIQLYCRPLEFDDLGKISSSLEIFL